MRVLVTGDKGYIGSVAMDYLSNAGFEVVGLDSGYYEPCLLGAQRRRYPALPKDVRDIMARDLQRFDAIVHLAALANDPQRCLDEVVTYDINHVASVRLASLARQAGVARFVFSSSCSTYGASGEGLVDESSHVEPLTAYGQAKALVEEAVAKLATPDFSPIFLRNATAYGVSPRMRFDLIINEMCARAHVSGEINLTGDGSAWRPFVHVEDICQAIAVVLEAPQEKVHNQIFNVGGITENYQLDSVIEIVRDMVPGCQVQREDPGADRRNYRVDFSKVGDELPEFRLQWDVKRGVRQMLDLFQEVGLTPEQLAGPRFRRIPYLTGLMSLGSLDPRLRWKLLKTALQG